MIEPTKDEFRCAMCGGIFGYQDDGSWTDADAKAEQKRDFGEIPLEHCEIICEDCYQKIRPDQHSDKVDSYQAKKN